VAIAVVDSLIDQESLSPPEQDYLDVLSGLVEAYEAETVPMTPASEAAFPFQNRSPSQ
jgi:HTH-type transcriptional regulator/antitoxin HigA